MRNGKSRCIALDSKLALRPLKETHSFISKYNLIIGSWLSIAAMLFMLKTDGISMAGASPLGLPIAHISEWDYGSAYRQSDLIHSTPSPDANYALLCKEAADWFNSSMTRRLWDRERLRRSFSQFNPQNKLIRNVMSKLERGRPITVMALGTSITAAHGGCWPTAQRCYADSRRLFSYGEETFGYLRAFMTLVNHTWPHPNHRLINAGKSGSSIYGYSLSECIQSMTSGLKSVDIVVIEHLTFLEFEGVEYIGTNR